MTEQHDEPPIDMRTHGPDGHWDYADIKRLCEYRDQLHETIRKLIEGEPVAMPTTCKHPPDARGLTGCLLCGATL